MINHHPFITLSFLDQGLQFGALKTRLHSWAFSICILITTTCGPHQASKEVLQPIAPTPPTRATRDTRASSITSPNPTKQNTYPAHLVDAYHLLGSPAHTLASLVEHHGISSYSETQDTPATSQSPRRSQSVSTPPAPHSAKSQDGASNNSSPSSAPAPRVIQNQSSENFENFSSCIIGDKPTISGLHESLINAQKFRVDGVEHVEYSHFSTNSRTELRNALDINAHTKVNFLSATTDASLRYFNHLTTKENKFYFVVKMTIENPPIKMSHVRLSPHALELYAKRGAHAFFKRCGKEAIVGFKTGGKLYITAEITTQGKEEAKGVQASLSASSHVMSAEGSIDNSFLKKMKNTKTIINYHIIARGGRANHIPKNWNSFHEVRDLWAPSVEKHGALLEPITQPYNSLLANITPQYEAMEEHNRSYMNALDRLRDIKDHITGGEVTYRGVDITDIQPSELKRLDDLMFRLTEKSRTCRDTINHKECFDHQLLAQAHGYAPKVFIEHSSCPTKTEYIKKHDANKTHCGTTTKMTGPSTQREECGLSHRDDKFIDKHNIERIVVASEKRYGLRTYTLNSEGMRESDRQKARDYSPPRSKYPKECRGSNLDRKSTLKKVFISSSPASCDEEQVLTYQRNDQHPSLGLLSSAPTALLAEASPLPLLALRSERYGPSISITSIRRALNTKSFGLAAPQKSLSGNDPLQLASIEHYYDLRFRDGKYVDRFGQPFDRTIHAPRDIYHDPPRLFCYVEITARYQLSCSKKIEVYHSCPSAKTVTNKCHYKIPNEIKKPCHVPITKLITNVTQ